MSEVVELVKDRRLMQAILLIRDRVPRDQFDLGSAERLVHQERLELGVRLRPDMMTITVEGLRERVNALTEPIVAIEAIWDGDSHGWFVLLSAIVERSSAKHPRYDEEWLAMVADERGDARLFSGEAPPWPEARRARDLGTALAEELGVPFHFGSPSAPDDCAPRWWDAET